MYVVIQASICLGFQLYSVIPQNGISESLFMTNCPNESRVCLSAIILYQSHDEMCLQCKQMSHNDSMAVHVLASSQVAILLEC